MIQTSLSSKQVQLSLLDFACLPAGLSLPFWVKPLEQTATSLPEGRSVGDGNQRCPTILECLVNGPFHVHADGTGALIQQCKSWPEAATTEPVGWGWGRGCMRKKNIKLKFPQRSLQKSSTVWPSRSLNKNRTLYCLLAHREKGLILVDVKASCMYIILEKQVPSTTTWQFLVHQANSPRPTHVCLCWSRFLFDQKEDSGHEQLTCDRRDEPFPSAASHHRREHPASRW